MKIRDDMSEREEEIEREKEGDTEREREKESLMTRLISGQKNGEAFELP